MMTLEFKVKGSAVEPYRVIITSDGGEIRAECTCEAARTGTHCKHRLALLAGDVTAAIDPDVTALGVVLACLPKSQLGLAMAEVARAEAELDRAKKQVAAARKRLAKAMVG